jgi:hypothetical protein
MRWQGPEPSAQVTRIVGTGIDMKIITATNTPGLNNIEDSFGTSEAGGKCTTL